MKTITATSASKEFGRFLDTVQREPVIVTKKNRPVAVTLSIKDAEEFLQFRIDAGIKRGLADIKTEKFKDITTAGTADRINQFKEMIADKT